MTQSIDCISWYGQFLNRLSVSIALIFLVFCVQVFSTGFFPVVCHVLTFLNRLCL